MRLPVHPKAERVTGEAPTQSEAQSGAQSGVQSLPLVLKEKSLSAGELVLVLGLKSKTGALKRTLSELLQEGLVEYTIPDKPTSRLQKYRLTEKGRTFSEASPK